LPGKIFSIAEAGPSVIRKESSLNTNFTQEESLPMFCLDALVFFRAKVKI
jgi:hypothetical protein